MSNTIQQILDTLQKNQADKKSQLTSIYEEHSAWLDNELSLIYKLIDHNPREDLIHGTKITDGIAVVLSGSEKRDDSFGSKKRKSPETAADFKLSPEQKRLLGDIDELIAAAGLPNDLNRLKKEQLLEELEKRGHTSCTMKTLKKDMIDVLKERLLLECRATRAEPVNTMLEQASKMLSSPVGKSVPMTPVTPVGIPKTPGRKISLMHEIRELVVNNQSSSSSGTTTEQQIESEFQARQSRHRASSLLSKHSMNNEGFNSTNSSTSTTTSTGHDMDIVMSPKPGMKTAVPHTEPEHEHEHAEEESNVIIQLSRQNTNDSLHSMDSKASIKSNVTQSQQPTTTSSSSSSLHHSNNHNNSANVPKKLLVSSTTAATATASSSVVNNKPLVPALQAAKQAKAAEELKALNKKKEQEQRVSFLLSL